ncbi:MAG TPA: hypothetical protein VMT20_02165 [Terriglobia bacterium]|nr:hypothetical protein [Terriglobia bacterium]
MKVFKFLLLASAVGLFAGSARADTIAYDVVVNGANELIVLNPAAYESENVLDPQLVVRRLKTGSVWFTGFTFSFSDDTGTGFFDFYNDNPASLTDLSITVTPGGPASDLDSIFACGIESQLDVLPFSNCMINEFGTDQTSSVLTFFGEPGLPPFSHFAFELIGFPAGGTVTVSATPQAAAEPGSLTLILTGGILLSAAGWLRRRRNPARH